MKKKFNNFLKKCYDWALWVSSGKYALIALLCVSFMESSFFPIPPDVLLIPLLLARRTQAFRIAFYTTLASVLGGYFGYAIGFFAFQSIEPYLSTGFLSKIEWFSAQYNHYGAWIVFGAGITPFPYKIITIASGLTGLNLWVFTMASVLARGLRFYLIAWLLWKYGEPMKAFIEKNLGWLSLAFFVLLIGCFGLIALF